MGQMMGGMGGAPGAPGGEGGQAPASMESLLQVGVAEIFLVTR